MSNKIQSRLTIFLSCVLACAAFAIAPNISSADIFETAISTINLVPTNTDVVDVDVAYHPAFNRYYASKGGETVNSYAVFDAEGTEIQNTPLDLDARGLFFNSNTNDLEIVAFNAMNGPMGLQSLGVNSAGFLTNFNTTQLDTLPGLPSDQSGGSYNASLDRIYSRDFGFGPEVTLINRSDGTSAGTISLDIAAAGTTTLSRIFIGYDSTFDNLVALDSLGRRALVFDLDGGFLGESRLSGNFSSIGAGYANGQLFVFDSGLSGFRGFQIQGVPEPTSFSLLGLAGFGLALVRRRRSD